MHCYYHGTLEITGGEMKNVEVLAKSELKKSAFVDSSDDIVYVEFEDVGEDDIRIFVAAAEKQGWFVNGKVPYYGDYEGFMIIVDNTITEYSTEEMAIQEYLDSLSVKDAMEISEKAVSMAGYLFLRLVFAKEDYPETVIENLEWVPEELLKECPAEILTRNLQQELEEGVYENKEEDMISRLNIYFGFEESECEKITKMLLDWRPAADTDADTDGMMK